MNEDAAKNKWCPMVRFSITRTPDGQTNRAEEMGYKATRCVGPDCGVWVNIGNNQGRCGLINQ